MTDEELHQVLEAVFRPIYRVLIWIHLVLGAAVLVLLTWVAVLVILYS